MQEAPSCIFDLYAFGGILLQSGCWTFFCSAAVTEKCEKLNFHCDTSQWKASGKKDIGTSAPPIVLWEGCFNSGNAKR